MEQDKKITTPDAIVILSGDIVAYEKDRQTHWRSTTFEEGDAFGVLGGHDRVEAAALLSKKYPNAYLVTTSRRLDGKLPTLAQVYADELRDLGVDEKMIVKEERSSNTQTTVTFALQLAKERGWKNILFVSSGYHLSRIQAFYENEKSTIAATTIASESVIIENNPARAEFFEKLRKSPSYQERVADEGRGIEALRAGAYHPAPIEDKQERPV